MHPSADVLVTAAGQREEVGTDQASGTLEIGTARGSSSFKIWHKTNLTDI